MEGMSPSYDQGMEPRIIRGVGSSLFTTDPNLGGFGNKESIDASRGVGAYALRLPATTRGLRARLFGSCNGAGGVYNGAGEGGYVKGDIVTSPNEVLVVVVGGNVYSAVKSPFNYGFGYPVASDFTSPAQADGISIAQCSGGFTGIFRSLLPAASFAFGLTRLGDAEGEDAVLGSIPLLMAGGGGGEYRQSSGSDYNLAGSGGYPNGQNGVGSAGTGGSQTAGGVASGTAFSKDGKKFRGGGGYGTGTTSGGSGYFGGSIASGSSTGTGGGSGFMHPTQVFKFSASVYGWGNDAEKPARSLRGGKAILEW